MKIISLKKKKWITPPFIKICDCFILFYFFLPDILLCFTRLLYLVCSCLFSFSFFSVVHKLLFVGFGSFTNTVL